MKALVTGGNGFIGSHICRVLLTHGIEVRVFLRTNASCENIKDLNTIEYAYGDLCNEESIINAMQNVDIVFHCAALHAQWLPEYQSMYDVNVQGTEYMCKAALYHNITKMIFTSTQNVIGFNKKQPSNEKTSLKKWEKKSHYTQSKILAEKIITKYYKKGLNVVIVNPSGPFGRGDKDPGSTGKIITNFINRSYPFYFPAWFNAVDVEDVAYGHYLAYTKGRAGEKYILAHTDVSLDQFFDILSALTGIKKPRVRIPRWCALVLAFILEIIANNITHKEPLLTIDRVRQRGKKKLLDNSKSIRELGLHYTSIDQSLTTAIQYFKEKGYIHL